MILLPLALVGFIILTSPTKRVSAQGTSSAAQLGPGQTSRVNLIDGSVNPEMISDYQAYSMLFRFVANRVGHERVAIRAYLRQIGMGGENCGACASNAPQVEGQIDLLIGAAEEFYTRTRPSDLKIKELAEQGPPATVDAQLASLRQEKERICREISDSLVSRLGASDAEKVRLHIGGMKRKMKVVQ